MHVWKTPLWTESIDKSGIASHSTFIQQMERYKQLAPLISIVTRDDVIGYKIYQNTNITNIIYMYKLK